jgi:ATP-binding cassette subfamily F protein uup
MAFGGPNLMDSISFEINEGERVCLVGRNGAGKTTLMNLISGNLTQDTGDIYKNKDSVITYLTQNIESVPGQDVYSYIVSSFGEEGKLMQKYHDLSHTDPSSNRLGEIHEKLDLLGAWNLQQRVEDVISRLELPADKDFEHLSGGLKRRVSLARALVKRPDLLLLDEPTNHLDIESIQWLEEFLVKNRFTLFFVTHDRSFLQRMATRIIELDRGVLTSFPGDFPTYLARKQELLEAEEKQNANFDKKLAQEEVWIRKGIQARRTRNEGRVRALLKMRQERQQRRELQGQAKLNLQEGVRSGDIVIAAENVTHSWGAEPLFKNFSTVINRKDRVAIIGRNGCGKSTLLKLLLGELQAEQGKITQGTSLQIVYFDQHREILDDKLSLYESIADGGDSVEINGKPRGVINYLGDFLFSSDRVWSPVGSLSGGERNRLLLARLFTKPSNVLVMDEPTNDLDAETMELLEEIVQNYEGTVLLVSHDRTFIDNIATSSLVFEGNGELNHYAGGYSDWQREQSKMGQKAVSTSSSEKKVEPKKQQRSRKLNNKERQDIEELPDRIEKWEEEKSNIEEKLGDPELYKNDPSQVKKLEKELETLTQKINDAYIRWDELEALQAEIENS